MEPSEILRRIKSFGIPGIVSLGVEWPEADVTLARRVIKELENRRALYTDHERQNPEGCVASIKEIRKMLNDEIKSRTTENELTLSLRGMRAACLKFLEKVESSPGVSSEERPYWVTDGTLGELRHAFGVHIGIIAIRYNLPIEDRLASILPPLDAET